VDGCRTCGRPLPERTGRRGRASLYCSPACRQKAYRNRQEPAAGDTVTGLIADIDQRVKRLEPTAPGTFYDDVTDLSSSVGRLRRVAKLAADAAGEQAAEDPADEWRFAEQTEPHRRELRVHCYRMLGSYDDAEDLVQETLLRAWRHRDTYAQGSNLRAWLYRIATNACLDFLRRNDRRPSSYEPIPGLDSGGGAPPARVPWLQPFPDELIDRVADDDEPDQEVVDRETMELVFLTAIQHLPPKQRAALILRDVLDYSATQAAELLDLSVDGVNSALLRARPTMREHLPADRAEWTRGESTEDEAAVLRRYMEVAGRMDFDAMAALLHEDVTLTMPPAPLWFVGRAAMMNFIRPNLDPASPMFFGEWRHLLTRANGRPATAGYVRRPGTSVYRAQAIDVLRIEGGLIVEITTFEPHLFPAFGLPLTVR
jgi:RNA polymerase sigma-70 factor (TIGR02960 family)